MQQNLIGKRISVHRISSDIAWCRPYCCTTVDTAGITLGAIGRRTSTSARLVRLLGYSLPPLPLGDVSERNHKETYASCIVSLATPTSSAFSASRWISSRNFAEKQEKKANERTRTADLLITNDNSCVAGVCTRLRIPYI